MWTLLHSHCHQILKQRQLLAPQESVLIAVSGGQDSVCLLKLLWDLQPRWHWHLAIAHCDHGWKTDQGMAQWVQALAQDFQLPFFLETTTDLAETEATARQWRYQALVRLAEAGGFGKIVTAHSQSDRAETFLYNLLRGSGTDGLQSLGWRRQLSPQVELVRPLLRISRAQTQAFCQRFQLPIWEDAYNNNLNFVRNRIRQELIPYLCQQFNPQAEKHLAQTLTILEAEADYWHHLTQQIYEQVAHQEPPRLERLALQQQPLALQRRVLRHFLQNHLPKMPTFEHIEALLVLLNGPQGSTSTALPGGRAVAVQGIYLTLITL